ncbi:serine/threonine-protein phosphatase with EF-hands 2-like, partial [Pollicipes pollicipes]|uniref:serine/threonine-protein phosphatase with EF-hands 2-like n=1 Tax=Pollicipes pollicipes TaxID=41117 RepID=UPI0018855694
MGCGLCRMERCRGVDGAQLKLRRLVLCYDEPDASPEAQKIEIGLRSAVLIQRWYRRYLARMELQQRYTWSIFQSIEYAGELDQMKLYNFFNALLEHLEDVKEPKPVLQEIHTDLHSRMYSSQEDLRQLTDPASVPVELAYRGPRVNFPMGPADLNTLIEAFKNKKLLHVHYVYGILHEAVRVLRPMASLHHASTAVSRQITVCGDLHG